MPRHHSRDLFARRPGRRPVTLEGAEMPTKAIGYFYFIPQDQMKFGGDRRNPVRRRPAVSICHREGRAYVLPATSQKRQDWFRLQTTECRPENRDQGGLDRDSYIGPNLESLTETGIRHARQCCRLVPPVRIALIDWFADYWRQKGKFNVQAVQRAG